jgi:hypothetical protein
MLRSLGRFAFGMALKLGGVIVAAGIGLLGLRWYGDRPLKKFCAGQIVGLSRQGVASRAHDAGLLISPGNEKDEVTRINQAVGLSWCVLDHDGSKVTNARFVRE